MHRAILSTGIRPLVYGGFIAVLVPLAFVVLAAMLAFATIGTAFDRSALSNAVATAASEIDRDTLALHRLVDLYNTNGRSDARDAVAAAQAMLQRAIAGLRTATGGHETPEIARLAGAFDAYASDVAQVDRLKHDEVALASHGLEPLAALLTSRLETLSAATEATGRGDGIVLCLRLLSAFLHVRLAADRTLTLHDPDTYAELDDVLAALAANLYAFHGAAEAIPAGPDTAVQMQTYIDLLDRATVLHQKVDGLIAGPLQMNGQSLLEAAAAASTLASRARDQATDIARRRLGRARALLLDLGAAGLLVGVGAAWGIGRLISGGIRRITATMAALAGGDLTVEPPFLRLGGEFGAMGRALGVFRDSMAEGERLALEQAAADRELRLQHVRFGAALGSMSEALCMFDAEGRLIVGNDRLADLLGLPVASIASGVTIRDLLARMSGVSGRLPADVRSLLHALSRLKSQGQRAAHVQDMADGRTLAVNFAPMEGDGWLVTLEDITGQRLVEAQIAHMAHHDSLTGLANRSLFQERLAEAVARCRRVEKSALLCLDLDHFKAVNDTLGHPIGDALLREVTARLREQVRETDTVARLGGDEFAVVQAGTTQPSDSTVLARRLIEAISAPYEIEGNLVIIGTSIGIALIPEDGDDPGRLMKAADMALYRAKADGRGRYCFFEPAMDALMQQRRTLELGLRRALARDEFLMVYQPQIHIASGVVCGFEALMRWQRPDHGMVSPADFIPLAEETGLIVPLGKWGLERACADAAGWSGDLKVAVNLSPVQFTSRTLVEDIAAALAAAGLPADRLELEITETTMLEDTDAVLARLHQLRDLGVSIALDDFGQGYSSLSYLRRFPFDKVKIDQSFIAGLGKVGDCDTIVAAVIDLCERLGMVTTSEGVETEAQLTRLAALRCTQAQGFLFSRPRPIGEIAALCRTLNRKAESVG